MEWWVALLVIFGSLLIVMASGLPIAFCFLLINIIGAVLLWGGTQGLEQIILSMRSSVTTFSLLPLPLFILMGEVIFRSQIAPQMIDALDKWLGRLPGRLGLLAVAAGTIFATLTGAAIASVAMLGETLVPEMERRGYKKSMSIGPILGSAGLAIMIPPSGLAILLAALGEFSGGKLLIAIIVPGLLMATIFAAYILLRCWLDTSIAPPYNVPAVPLSEKLVDSVKYLMPLWFIIFLVIGIIFVGVATPTEAAATGAMGTFVLAACYRRLNWDVVKKSVAGTINITVMAFMIISGAAAFSQILAFTQATPELAQLALGLPVAPVFVMAGMQVVGLFLGMFINSIPIMMVCVPIFMPVVRALGFDPVWFGAIFLLVIETGGLTPPFGISCFVMKGVAPKGTTMEQIYRAALPFVSFNLVVIALMLIFPQIVLWLPSIMH